MCTPTRPIRSYIVHGRGPPPMFYLCGMGCLTTAIKVKNLSATLMGG